MSFILEEKFDFLLGRKVRFFILEEMRMIIGVVIIKVAMLVSLAAYKILSLH